MAVIFQTAFWNGRHQAIISNNDGLGWWPINASLRLNELAI